jgi:hypothetical protein
VVLRSGITLRLERGIVMGKLVQVNASEVCRVTGILQQTLHSWIDGGLVVPLYQDRNARGKPHYFSPHRH